MAINSATIEAERATSSAPNRVPINRSIAIGLTAVIVAIVTLVAYVRSSDTETVRPTQPESQSRDDIVQDLVDRGIVPSPTLQPTPLSRDDIVQDLVDRGIVPAASTNN